MTNLNWSLAISEITLALLAMGILVFGVLWKRGNPSLACAMLGIGALASGGAMAQQSLKPVGLDREAQAGYPAVDADPNDPECDAKWSAAVDRLDERAVSRAKSDGQAKLTLQVVPSPCPPKIFYYKPDTTRERQ